MEVGAYLRYCKRVWDRTWIDLKDIAPTRIEAFERGRTTPSMMKHEIMLTAHAVFRDDGNGSQTLWTEPI